MKLCSNINAFFIFFCVIAKACHFVKWVVSCHILAFSETYHDSMTSSTLSRQLSKPILQTAKHSQTQPTSLHFFQTKKNPFEPADKRRWWNFRVQASQYDPSPLSQPVAFGFGQLFWRPTRPKPKHCQVQVLDNLLQPKLGVYHKPGSWGRCTWFLSASILWKLKPTVQ